MVDAREEGGAGVRAGKQKDTQTSAHTQRHVADGLEWSPGSDAPYRTEHVT